MGIGLSCSFWQRNIFCQLDCLQSPIFSLDRQDRALTGTGGRFGFIYTPVSGVGLDLTLIQDGRP